ncbi:MAG: P-II family nitrogen regulator [Chloroflexi bacterium]|nr:P-II family nitrogen regulator [Chloroflexota bacterium]
MYQMVMLVIDDVNVCSAVLDAWETAGAPGITILDSTGIGRVRKAGLRDDMPLLPSIANLMRAREEHHRTLFTVVDKEELVDKLIEIAERIIGDLSQPNKGILFVMPVSRVVGLRNKIK